MEEEIRRAQEEYLEALNEFRRTGNLNEQTMRRLQQAQRKLTEVTDDQTDASEEATKKLKEFYRTTKEVASGFADTFGAVRQNRENFESLNPAIRATGTIFAGAANVIGGGIEKLGASIALGSAAVGALPGVIAGLGIAGLGNLFGGLAEETTKLGVKFMEFGTSELNRVVGAFQQIGRVGAIGANGLSGLYEQSVRSGLSLQQLTGVIESNSQGLAFATGTSLDGANAVVAVTQAMTPFRNELLNLGFNLQEQSEYAAEALIRERRLGVRENLNANQQAMMVRRYITQLDELTRITGLSRTEAQNVLDQQLRDVRFRASLALANQRDPTGDLRREISNTAGVLRTLAPELGAGFMDAMGGNVATDAAKRFQAATGGLGTAIVNDLRNNTITSAEALARIQQATANRFESLGGFEFAARVGKLGTFFEPVLLDMMEITEASNLTAAASRRVADQGAGAAQSMDGLTKRTNQAILAMQSMAMQLDAITKDDVLPLATAGIKTFAEVLDFGVEKMAEAFKLLPNVDENIPGRATGGPVKGGSPYMVGEAGPEIFTPGASGQITNAHITGKLDAISHGSRFTDSGYGSAPKIPGFQQTFMPGIGKVTKYNNEGLQKTIIEGVNGAIEEYTAMAMGGVTQEMYSAGGQDYQRMSAMYTDTTATTNFLPSGPRSYYDSIMDNVRPQDLRVEQAYTEMLDDDGTGKPGKRRVEFDVTDQVSSKQLMEVFSAMTAEMQQIAQNTRSGADSSRQLLRQTSS